MKAACQHCGGLLDIGVLARHAANCPRNPARRAAIAAALEDADNPGYGVPTPIYKQRVRAGCGLPAKNTLSDAFGDWPAVCAHFGLRPPGDLPRLLRPSGGAGVLAARGQVEAAAIAEAAAAQAAVRQLLQDDAERGLPVCGARRLPDGRIAYVLR